MAESSKDTGVILTLVERFETQRLPRALAIKERVDRGEKLDEMDVAFLEEVFEDAGKIESLLDRHPEWQSLAAKVAGLYAEIMDKAMENENKG